MFRRFLPCLVMALACTAVAAEETLPLVDRGEARHLRENCRAILKAMDEARSPLPAEPRRELDELLAGSDEGPAVLIAIQKILDPFCLVGVTINPESRVKGARGPAPAELVARTPRVFLVKVQNDAGVTQALSLTSLQLAGSAQTIDHERWLHAAFMHGNVKSPPRKLSGREVEYLLLGCQATEAGKREARLVFDVGQGTQDLGFRAEVPILFTVRRP